MIFHIVSGQSRFTTLISSFLYPPQTVFVGGYTVFTLSVLPTVCVCVCACVRYVSFP